MEQTGRRISRSTSSKQQAAHSGPDERSKSNSPQSEQIIDRKTKLDFLDWDDFYEAFLDDYVRNLENSISDGNEISAEELILRMREVHDALKREREADFINDDKAIVREPDNIEADLLLVTQTLSNWDKAARSKLIADMRSGELLERYQNGVEEPAAAALHMGATIPPGGQLYAERPDRKETAPAFIERVYGEAGWLTGSFTRADLRKLDPSAAMGLHNWEKNHKQRAALNLPTVQERNDRELATDSARTHARQNPNARLRSALWRRENK